MSTNNGIHGSQLANSKTQINLNKITFSSSLSSSSTSIQFKLLGNVLNLFIELFPFRCCPFFELLVTYLLCNF